jgi:putative transposase
MKRKHHTPEQIIHKLRQADAELAAGQPIAAICQKLGVAEATFHRWRNQYGGMKANDARRLKELERENARLKRLVADQALDQAILKEALRLVGRSSTSSLLARRGAVRPSTTCRRSWRSRSVGPVESSVSRGLPSGTRRGTRTATDRWCSGCWNWSGRIRATVTAGSRRYSGKKVGW